MSTLYAIPAQPAERPPAPVLHPALATHHSTFHIAHSTFPILLVLLLAFGLRVAGLDRQSLWYDEGVSAYLTTLPIAEMTRWTAEDIQPPLYYYLLAGWAGAFGHSEAALRWLSVLFSLLTVALAYRAGRRLHSPGAGLLAALFCAVSPLYVWYAQEARNYAPADVPGPVGVDAVVRPVQSFVYSWPPFVDGRGVRRTGVRRTPLRSRRAVRSTVARRLGVRRTPLHAGSPTGVVCVAALYTHYFAAFLLVFHVLFLAVVAWRERWPRPAWLPALLTWAGVAVAYLPWLPFQLGRLGADQSYWAGALKLDEALRKLLISFSLGETVLEPIGWPLALGFLGILIACGAALFAWGRRRSLAFLALYLLTPIAGVLLLALQTPKFNPRYLMPASPAFFLLLACGLAAGFCLFLLAGFAYSDRNLYVDPAFTKADFRGVAAYLRQHRQPDEAIILVSGHMFPVFDYYLPDTQRILLPPGRTLSTENVVGFEAGPELQSQLTGTSGAWVVRWQDGVVDPNGVVELLLDAAGQRQPVDASFWQVRLDHYRWPAGPHVPSEPPIGQPAAANFGGVIQLVGWSQPRTDEYVLFWEALGPISDDLDVSLRLLDVQDLPSGPERPPASGVSLPDDALEGRRNRAPAAAGSPPCPASRPASITWKCASTRPTAWKGWTCWMPPARPKANPWPSAPSAWPMPAARRMALRWAYHWIWTIAGVEVWPCAASAGCPRASPPARTLPVDMAWSCIQPTARPWSATLKLQPAGRADMAVEQDLLLMSFYPTDTWRAGEWLRGRVLIRVPADWPAGTSDLIPERRRGRSHATRDARPDPGAPAGARLRRAANPGARRRPRRRDHRSVRLLAGASAAGSRCALHVDALLAAAVRDLCVVHRVRTSAGCGRRHRRPVRPTAGRCNATDDGLGARRVCRRQLSLRGVSGRRRLGAGAV